MGGEVDGVRLPGDEGSAVKFTEGLNWRLRFLCIYIGRSIETEWRVIRRDIVCDDGDRIIINFGYIYDRISRPIKKPSCCFLSIY